MSQDAFAVPGEPSVFDLDGSKFKLSPLPCEVSLAGLDLIQGVLAPVIQEGISMLNLDAKDEKGEPTIALRDNISEEAFRQFVANALKSFGVLPKFYALFAGHCEVWRSTNAQVGLWLKVREDKQIFARRSSAAIAWIVACLSIEYSDFLDGTGLGLIMSQANLLISRLGSDTKSG
jgi:hypothetical protein